MAVQSLVDKCVIDLAINYKSPIYGIPFYLLHRIMMCRASLEILAEQYHNCLDLQKNASKIHFKPNGMIALSATLKNLPPAHRLMFALRTEEDFNNEELFKQLSPKDKRWFLDVSREDTIVRINWLLLMGCVYEIGPELFDAVNICVERKAVTTLGKLLSSIEVLSPWLASWIMGNLPTQTSMEMRMWIESFLSQLLENP
ncbi:hypothetical protein QR680_014248 [Steinernema hermaphroditum]|uniref:Uncharacterized protein n=1 Tax=Steinernema hermaphroditum TaxID=289476 RepID=A0AA39IAD1_9BILA|nr:hypothetical protein QR680_014248 [Steinernema hermaphroditum]